MRRQPTRHSPVLARRAAAQKKAANLERKLDLKEAQLRSASECARDLQKDLTERDKQLEAEKKNTSKAEQREARAEQREASGAIACTHLGWGNCLPQRASYANMVDAACLHWFHGRGKFG